ncbi:MAG: hypothetical protein COV67_02325 [Nitrospinae bacterium CG11_big_fil_rev_8_21_14_0_20_56_8]|nr:MAG: hypothetical protein COV67_02325 [Nitrospinae bacterium CG11_big_fil_rev_8_21_14_0_20_56_8]
MRHLSPSILLIDDEPHVLELISDDLKEEGFQVSTAKNGAEGIRLFKKKPCDVVITDMVMEGLVDGIQVLKEIKKIDPSAPVVILTGYWYQDTAREAFQAGVNDFILKPCNSEKLVGVIENCLNPVLVQAVLPKPRTESRGHSNDDSSSLARLKKALIEVSLSQRETEVILLVSDGKTDAEIGRELQISTGTVKSHLKNIFRKFKVHSRAQLIAHLYKKAI